MSTVTTGTKVTGQEARILREGYGEGAWHGPDLKAALADVAPDLAFWRPAPGRHNIAEIALHHAYCARSVRSKLTGLQAEPFVLEGDDWFEISDKSGLTWLEILRIVEREQARLAGALADRSRRGTHGELTDAERFDLVLGITCHAVYHAGQVQLIKRLRA